MSETTKPQANSAFGDRRKAFCKITLPCNLRDADLYVICRLGGPYSEKL